MNKKAFPYKTISYNQNQWINWEKEHKNKNKG